MKKILFALMAVLIIVSSCFLGYHDYMTGKLAQATIIQKEEVQKENEYREKLASWVFDHSSKVSRQATRQIVDEVFRYDHPILLLAICQVESEFSPTAYSSAQAVGLGQIRWTIWGKTLTQAGILKEARDLYDVSMNIRATNYIIGTLMKSAKGNPVAILESYVGGKSKPYVDKVSQNFLHLSMIKRT